MSKLRNVLEKNYVFIDDGMKIYEVKWMKDTTQMPSFLKQVMEYSPVVTRSVE
jgi:uncharacterized protein YerC